MTNLEAPPSRRQDVILAAALAAFFAGVQFYTSLASLAPTPPVGYLFLGRFGAGMLAAVLAGTAAIGFARLRAPGAFVAPETATSRRMLAWWMLALVPASLFGLNPSWSLQTVAVAAVAAVFHVSLVRWYGRPPVAAAVVATYLLTGGLAALASIVMVLTRHPAELFALNNGRAAGPFVTTNQLGAFLVLDLFVALGTARATRRRALALAAWLNVAIAAVALGFSFSRGAWIGAGVGACAYAAFVGARKSALGGAALLLIAAAALAAGPVAGHNPAERFARLSTLEGGYRALALFPLTGSGPMTYFHLFPAIRPSNGGLPGSFEALHPHNLILSLAGELGLAGLAAIVAGWLAFARGMRERLRGAPEANRRLACGICAAFVALFVQGMADLVGVVELTFVWIPYAALALGAASHGLAE